jgi:hypothetical protein
LITVARKEASQLTSCAFPILSAHCRTRRPLHRRLAL